MTAMKARMRREMMEERKELERQKSALEGPQEIVQDSAPVLSVILYKCPDIGPAVLPKDEMEAYIEEFLLKQLADEPEMTSALMIHTLNKDKERVQVCVDTLSKYLDNIIKNPEEEKFRKIRLGNKAFKERVASLQGTEEFIQAVGFQVAKLPFEDREEIFYVLDVEMAKDAERISGIKEVLHAAEPLRPQLDRALKLYHPTSGSAASHFDIPHEFYNVSPEELKKEQQRRQEAVENYGMLRTKAMRERDEKKELRKYRFTLIRVRFPDGTLLQGTFKALEKLSALISFVRENLTEEWMPFHLMTSTGQNLNEEDKCLAELGLVPAVVVNFKWDESVMADIKAQQGAAASNSILKPEIMFQIQSM